VILGQLLFHQGDEGLRLNSTAMQKRDPAGGHGNRYRFANGDPVHFQDRSGRASVSCDRFGWCDLYLTQSDVSDISNGTFWTGAGAMVLRSTTATVVLGAVTADLLVLSWASYNGPSTSSSWKLLPTKQLSLVPDNLARVPPEANPRR
jgi:hypothetical protein